MLTSFYVLIGLLGTGLGHVISLPKLTGGSNVEDISQVPYIAVIEFMGRFSCSAVIIAPTWLATSATCMELIDAVDIVVRTGATKFETGGHLWPVERIVRHPLYKQDDTYDLALVEISLEITVGQAINIIGNEPLPGTLANVTGWGASIEDGSAHRDLRYVQLPLADRVTCTQHYHVEIDDRRLCTMSVNAGPCDYDEGDPLVVDNRLAGLVAWTFPEPCGTNDSPSVYVNLVHPAFRGFIANVTGV